MIFNIRNIYKWELDRFLPRVNAVIQESAIHVISARTEYEDIFPGDYYKWKIEAFKDLKRNYDEDVTLFIYFSRSRVSEGS